MNYIKCSWSFSNAVLRSVGFFFTIATCAFIVEAQITKIANKNDRPLSCDEQVALQDIVVSDALEKLTEGSLLFVILRKGSEESPGLATRRLYNIRRYFNERGKRLQADKVMIAVGDPVEGFGRIEYYIDGRLHKFILYPKNGYVCHSCCGPDNTYFPEKARAPKGRN